MSDLRDLYQEVIVDHAKRPRNFHRLSKANRHAEGYNPLCGDKLAIDVVVEDGVVKDVGFIGAGCAVSTASASLMSDLLKGKTLDEAEVLFGRFHDLLTGGEPLSEEALLSLGKLAAFSGVCEYPARVKCATLAWHSARAAIRGEGEQISTEDGGKKPDGK
ncbi:MAG: Fe-S cluster assembly sulfur transfer protein SufU [Myxococcaceae bacterium]